MVYGTGYGESGGEFKLTVLELIASTIDHGDDITERLQSMQVTDSKIMDTHFPCLVHRVAQAFCKVVVDWYFPAGVWKRFDVLYVDKNESMLLAL